jgi:hypothetical protein
MGRQLDTHQIRYAGPVAPSLVHPVGDSDRPMRTCRVHQEVGLEPVQTEPTTPAVRTNRVAPQRAPAVDRSLPGPVDAARGGFLAVC